MLLNSSKKIDLILINTWPDKRISLAIRINNKESFPLDINHKIHYIISMAIHPYPFIISKDWVWYRTSIAANVF
jgi:hypothetical protein